MSETGTAELSSLLNRLNAFCAQTPPDAAPARTPTPDEAMAIYAVAVRLVETRLDAPDADLAGTRDLLLGTRRVLHAALEQVETDGTGRRFRVIDGGRARLRRRPARTD